MLCVWIEQGAHTNYNDLVKNSTCGIEDSVDVHPHIPTEDYNNLTHFDCSQKQVNVHHSIL